MKPKLRMGMVGGGRDAFIGAVHRMAARLEDRIELVCGAFSSTKQKALESGKDLLLDTSRAYGSYREMFRREAKLPEEQRMQFVSIVTPNNMHYPIAMAALDGGFHVVCDKPMTLTLDEALNLQKKVKQTKRLFCLTHNYTAYPMVKQGRQRVKAGKLGKIRRVVVEYPQGWLASRAETAGLKQAAWRTDPRRSGPTGCMGDIGSHCQNLAEYVTGLEVVSVCADLQTCVKGRQLEDDGSVLLRFKGGARGILWASQIAVGVENALSIRVYGEKGGLEWHQQKPNTLLVHKLGKPTEIHGTPPNIALKAGAEASRLPAGYPEGYLETFATIYANFARALENVLEGTKIKEDNFDYPSVADGVRGVTFLHALVASNKSDEKWTDLDSL
jgi:predicted dehydrogenase